MSLETSASVSLRWELRVKPKAKYFSAPCVSRFSLIFLVFASSETRLQPGSHRKHWPKNLKRNFFFSYAVQAERKKLLRFEQMCLQRTLMRLINFITETRVRFSVVGNAVGRLILY